MLTRFWWSPLWEAFERACGQEPGTRARLLESATWQTRVLDLTADEATLWAGVRKSYHSLIHRLERDETFTLREGLPMEVLSVCRPIHIAVAGRETRSEDSWRLQASWVLTGYARCWIARRDETPVGFLYALVDRECAYYFSAAKTEANVGHALQWHAILALKAAGVRWYELGWQNEARDEKGQAIEFAKRAWGGNDVDIRECYGDLAGAGAGSGTDAVADAVQSAG